VPSVVRVILEAVKVLVEKLHETVRVPVEVM
jgi:hypothetical protein